MPRPGREHLPLGGGRLKVAQDKNGTGSPGSEGSRRRPHAGPHCRRQTGHGSGRQRPAAARAPAGHTKEPRSQPGGAAGAGGMARSRLPGTRQRGASPARPQPGTSQPAASGRGGKGAPRSYLLITQGKTQLPPLLQCNTRRRAGWPARGRRRPPPPGTR